MNLQIIGFQNLLELTQDLVVVLKDHEFHSFSWSEDPLGKVLPPSVALKQQDLESIPVNFESLLLFVDSFDGVWFYSSGREIPTRSPRPSRFV